MADFMLRYRGELTSNGNAKQKGRIRRGISPQLEELCAVDPLFSAARQVNVTRGTIEKGQLSPGPITENLFCVVNIGGYDFIPIVGSLHKLVAELDIIFLRRGPRGSLIKHGGDLDNRIKTLLDALRMPHDVSELGEPPATQEGERLFCLLEDDALITKVSVDTFQLLEPAGVGRDTDVDLLIHVTVRSSAPIMANAGF